MKHTVVGIGEVLWDVLPSGRKPGGAPANFSCHVTQFGMDGCIVSAVGKDADGEELMRQFERLVGSLEIARVDFPTGRVNVELDADGVPSYDIVQPVAWDHIPFTSQLEALARKTSAVCFGSLAQRSPESRATIRKFVKAVAPDAIKVFDINLRQNFYDEDVIGESLELCNVLKINDEELGVLIDMLSLPSMQAEACGELVRRFRLRALILTCGAQGSYVFSPGEGGIAAHYEPVPEVDVCDTVGAGDSFTAAFVAALLRGLPITEAQRLATRTAAFVCSSHGATPELPAHLTARGW